MGIRLTWSDQNLAEDGHRIYRSLTSMAGLDVSQLPAPVVELGPDVELWDDPDVVEGETYYYRVGAFVGGVEMVSDELVIEAVDLGVPTDNLLFHYTMDNRSGSTLYSEVNGFTGTISGAVTQPGKMGSVMFALVNHVVDNGTL